MPFPGFPCILENLEKKRDQLFSSIRLNQTSTERNILVYSVSRVCHISLIITEKALESDL